MVVGIAAQEKLAVRLVMVIGIAASMELLDYFCALWDLLVIFYFDLKVRERLPIANPPSTTDEGVFCKVGCLVSSGGRNCCGYGFFFACLSAFRDLLVNF